MVAPVRLGRTDLVVSRFGLGCMRFPSDEREAAAMVRYALDHGVNYLDTAHAYPRSEEILGRALAGGYREKAVIAAKCPVWKAEKPEDLEAFLDEELNRLSTDRIDMYLLHDVNRKHWEYVERFDGLAFLDRMVKKGKIRYRACSFHGPPDHYRTVLRAFDWDMIQVQMGLLDEKNQAGLQGLYEASDRGIPTVVMEPLRGGVLARTVPPAVRRMMKESPRPWSLVEWAFRYLIDKPEVGLVLSGTSDREQLKDNIRIFSTGGPDQLTREDRAFIVKLQSAFEGAYAVACTGCGYCLPCPAGVAIPEIFSLYNMKRLTKHWVDGLVYQRNYINRGTDPSACTQCGRCESLCPQEIPIVGELNKAHTKLGGGRIGEVMG